MKRKIPWSLCGKFLTWHINSVHLWIKVEIKVTCLPKNRQTLLEWNSKHSRTSLTYVNSTHIICFLYLLYENTIQVTSYNFTIIFHSIPQIDCSHYSIITGFKTMLTIWYAWESLEPQLIHPNAMCKALAIMLST